MRQTQSSPVPSMYVDVRTPVVLLQTVKAPIFYPDQPLNTKNMTILLDSGSQRSYIINTVQKDLCIVIEKSRNLKHLVAKINSDTRYGHVCYQEHSWKLIWFYLFHGFNKSLSFLFQGLRLHRYTHASMLSLSCSIVDYIPIAGGPSKLEANI